MIRMLHRDTGSVMWVHETRLAEYLEAGHSLAPAPEPPPLPERPEKTERSANSAAVESNSPPDCSTPELPEKPKRKAKTPKN